MMTQAAEALAQWMREHDMKPPAVADAVGVSKAAVYAWRKGDYRPDPIVRAKLERWTDGVVRERDWDTDDERAALALVAPYVPTTSAA
jgi:DNA-binding XRE family transcriptional regulator